MECFTTIGHNSSDRPVMDKRIANAQKAKLTPAGAAMYLAGKVKLCRANEVAKAANGGKGFINR